MAASDSSRSEAVMPDVVSAAADGGIGVITINRPEARNAVNGAIARGIAAGRGFGGIVEQPPGKPVIAAVEGYALAGGFELALACDLIVASEAAIFGLPEVRRGLVAGAGGLLRLPRRIPYHLAMEIALTGGRFPASRMQEAGLINKLVPAGQALAGARELAARVDRAGR